MTTDFRALCAELIFIWNSSSSLNGLFENMAPLIARARTALAEPEPPDAELMRLRWEGELGFNAELAQFHAALIPDADLLEHLAPQRVEGVGELVEELELMANCAADACRFGDAHFLTRAATRLSRQAPPPLPAEGAVADGRSCTCHPDDNPPRPCPKRYALDECREFAEREVRTER
jgi:hypothetical protein